MNFVSHSHFLPTRPTRSGSEPTSSNPCDKQLTVNNTLGGINFRIGKSCRTMPLVGGFSQGSPVSPALSLQCCSIFTSITLIGSQDLAVKSHPNVLTHSFT
ncbi:hypothetical protein PR048_013260 [Dryococelus australis]|uniref:Uncharacterized protein n=1 Tax=Dryococelus australis TaxID=614101 RepID=A0ABQ9HRZ4_9NEOP|nr:hypothetical protein PR048_013260 [Dryococelus australis]